MCKAVEIGKQGDVLRYHPGIKILTKNKSCRLISTQKGHSKEYTYRNHCTKFYKLLPSYF